jgi:hypothetical protein
MPVTDTRRFFDMEPAEDEIKVHQDGGKYIPYPVIVKKLNELCGADWDIKNFSHLYFVIPDHPDLIRVSGSVEVVIRYIDDELQYLVTRTLSGAATFYTNEYFPNEHWAATLKSLCVVNAVQVLGRNFGWGLNDEPEKNESDKTPQRQLKGKPAPVFLPPDPGIKAKYEKAKAEGDQKTIDLLEKIYDFHAES